MFSRLGFLTRERIDAVCLAIKRVKSSFDFGEREFYFLTLPMWQALRKSKKQKTKIKGIYIDKAKVFKVK